MGIVSRSALVGFAVTAFSTGAAYGFGGQIAVGMNAANEVDDIQVPFTADATLETAEFTIQTKIHFQSGKIRDEFQMEGQNLVYITRPDQGVTWMLMPQGFYMEIPQDQAGGQGDQQVQQYRLVEREVVGEEVVNGMQTTRYRVIYETNDGRYGGFTWFNENNIAVRAFMVSDTDGERQRVNFEMSNLVVGPVDDALFELPEGAQQFNMGALISGFGGGASGFPGQAQGGSIDQPPADANQAQQGSFSGELVDAAKEGAQDAAVEETRRGVRDAVGRGFRGLRNRLDRD